MKALLPQLAAVAALCALLSSCAQIGAPLPPSLELPRPPSDLRAVRKGSRVTLTWSEPTLTTDRQSVRYLGPTLVCQSAGPDMVNCGAPVATLSPPAAAQSTKSSRESKKKSQSSQPPPLQSFTAELPASALGDNPDAELIYALEVQNRNDRSAGLSNRVHVSAIRTLPAPADLAAKLTGDGAILTWTSIGLPSPRPGVRHVYRIYRRNETDALESSGQGGAVAGDTRFQTANNKNNKKDVVAGEVPVGTPGPAQFLDSIEWEKTYSYWVTAVTIVTRPESEVQVEGDDSPIVRVVAHDIFPPAVPAGLQAVYSGEGQKPFIDLIWAPVASADLAGYNIYRSEPSGAPIKLNSDLIKTPSYRDPAVQPGRTYTYTVSAVDVRANESAKSEPASETVPAQ